MNHDMQGILEQSDQQQQMTQMNYYELLAAKMDKAKALYETQGLQLKTKNYQDIATERFESQFAGDAEQARLALQQFKNKN